MSYTHVSRLWHESCYTRTGVPLALELYIAKVEGLGEVVIFSQNGLRTWYKRAYETYDQTPSLPQKLPFTFEVT